MAQTMMVEPKAVETVMNGGPKVAAIVEKRNRIQVSNTKKPLFFYLNLAKRYIKQHNDVELSALGMAIPTVVTIAEILKSNGVAVEKKVLTSTVGSKDENKGRLVQKAKLEIVLEKNDTPRAALVINNQKAATDNAKAPASASNAKLTTNNDATVIASCNVVEIPAATENGTAATEREKNSAAGEIKENAE